MFAKMRLLVLLIVLAQPGFSGTPLTAEQQSRFIKKMNAELRTMRNFRAEFVQERHLSVLTAPLISKGICAFQTPDKLRWEVTSPYRTALIYNADQVAKFEMENGRLRKMHFGAGDMMRKVLKQIISWMQGDFNQGGDVYDLRVYKTEPLKLELVPKSQKLRSALRSIQLFADTSTYRVFRVLIRETDKDYIQIDFKRMKENISLPKATFDTEQPALFK